MSTSSPSCSRNQGGFTLLETLVGLGFTAFVALTAVAMLSLMSHTGISILGSANSRIAQLKTAAIVRTALSNLERTRLNLGPIIIDGGDIPTANHPLSSLSGTSGPRSGSTVVSFIELSPLHRGVIEETTFGPEGVTSITACRFTSVPTSQDFRSFVAVGLEGSIHFTGVMQKVSESCGIFSGSPLQSLFGSRTPKPQGLIAMWGVLREYSLFIDRSGQFRMVSHVGQRIIENQPIARGLRSISLYRQQLSEGVYLFHIAVHTAMAPPFLALAPRLFSSRGIWQELWS